MEKKSKRRRGEEKEGGEEEGGRQGAEEKKMECGCSRSRSGPLGGTAVVVHVVCSAKLVCALFPPWW